ncbi:hypothetical protein ACFLYR_09610 [Chloroflexota bacterium]
MSIAPDWQRTHVRTEGSYDNRAGLGAEAGAGGGIDEGVGAGQLSVETPIIIEAKLTTAIIPHMRSLLFLKILVISIIRLITITNSPITNAIDITTSTKSYSLS